jgi:hypothetical protein
MLDPGGVAQAQGAATRASGPVDASTQHGLSRGTMIALGLGLLALVGGGLYLARKR